jgi:hypothetical protein
MQNADVKTRVGQGRFLLEQISAGIAWWISNRDKASPERQCQSEHA